MRKTDAFRRAAALMAALSITVSLAAPAFAGTYYIDDGDITITKDENGQTVQQNGTTKDDSGEIIITTHKKAITSLESDLEGPAAEDSGFGPVVEDNYQPAQPEDAEEPKDADQPEDAEEPEGADQPEDAEEPKDADQPESAEEPKSADRQESADRQAQPQQAAPAAAPAASTPKNDKGNGFWGNTITVINNFADKVLNLTLKDVKIDVSGTGKYDRWGNSEKGKAALSVQGKGNVEIELDGKNELKSGVYRAGLEKTSTGTLTLKDDNQKDDNQKAGSLTATGGKYGAGIGGGEGGNGEDITITGGTVNAASGDGADIDGGAGIGGGEYGNGEDITITGGTVTATGGASSAGIGGDNGKNITITGGTVTATGGTAGAGIGGGGDDGFYGNGENITITGGTVNAKGGVFGAGIGGGYNGGDTRDDDGNLISYGSGKEVQADISGLMTTGYIHHIIYNEDGSVKQEWWEFGHLQPAPDTTENPNAPAEGSNGVSLGTPGLHVETLEGSPLPFNAQRQGRTLTVRADTLAARLHGTREALAALREQGVEQIEFVTTLKTTTLSVAELLAEGGSRFALEHNGPVSRLLSAAQAESLECQELH